MSLILSGVIPLEDPDCLFEDRCMIFLCNVQMFMLYLNCSLHVIHETATLIFMYAARNIKNTDIYFEKRFTATTIYSSRRNVLPPLLPFVN